MGHTAQSSNSPILRPSKPSPEPPYSPPSPSNSPPPPPEPSLHQPSPRSSRKPITATAPAAGTPSPLSEILEENEEAVDALKSLLQQKLELGEDEEALKILNRLISAQPEVTDWKFLAARLTNEIGDVESARGFYEEILATNPLSFEALFENALLMDRCGEGEAVIERLEDALRLLRKKTRLKKPGMGMIYSLLDKNDEAKEQFAKYRELSPKKFEVDGYLRSPLSRIKVFGTD
ncbi:Tetratricopeptide-like helical domain superfamily [Sesbania bispinosa]|nr:Tetratricopeptide-like helical domain superfamily [Sesbania bispinosa]